MAENVWLRLQGDLISMGASSVKRIAVTDQNQINFEFNDGTNFKYEYADSVAALAALDKIASVVSATAPDNYAITNVSPQSASITASTFTFYITGINFITGMAATLQVFDLSGAFITGESGTVTFINSTMLRVDLTGLVGATIPSYFTFVISGGGGPLAYSSQYPCTA